MTTCARSPPGVLLEAQAMPMPMPGIGSRSASQPMWVATASNDGCQPVIGQVMEPELTGSAPVRGRVRRSSTSLAKLFAVAGAPGRTPGERRCRLAGTQRDRPPVRHADPARRVDVQVRHPDSVPFAVTPAAMSITAAGRSVPTVNSRALQATRTADPRAWPGRPLDSDPAACLPRTTGPSAGRSLGRHPRDLPARPRAAP